MESHRLSILLIVTVLMTSCASFPHRSSNRLSDDQAELVSRDFVTAMSKLRGYGPRQTTVQFHSPSTEFAKKLHDAMRFAGYGMQILPKDEIGANQVSYVSEQYETSDRISVAYEVTMGRVKLGREYEVRHGRVFPIAALSVNGSSSTGQGTVDNSIFREADSNEWSPIQNRQSIVVVDPTRTNPNITGDFELGRLTSEMDRPASPRRNVMDIGGSNYSSLFKLYEASRKETLIFPDDSLVLGNRNKKTIASFANQFDPTTDIISVLGCSHGATSINNGNALLANGRASRVKEELIMANVSPDMILDEGCWANEKHKVLPGRGVVLTLRKKIKRG